MEIHYASSMSIQHVNYIVQSNYPGIKEVWFYGYLDKGWADSHTIGIWKIKYK